MIAPSRSSSEIAGSKLATASTFPVFTATTAAGPPPMPMTEMSLSVMPTLLRSILSPIALAEPGPVTPTFIPLRSCSDMYDGRLVLLDADHEPERIGLQRDRFDRMPLDRHVERVLVCAAADVGAAADQRLERFGAALEIADLDVQAFLGEIAAALRDRQRQVGDQRLAADGQLDP